MITIRTGTVSNIIHESEDLQKIELTVSEALEQALVYPSLTGRVALGDKVAFNATAVDLDLGTGGDHFVICNLSNPEHQTEGRGHIMKMRYTPMQTRVLAVEEPQSKHHDAIKAACSIEEMPIVAALLHSHIAPISIAIKHLAPDLKIAYVMTDGGALPAHYSRLTGQLKQKGLLDSVITCGHAFGGDFEAINLYSAILTAKHVANADIAIIAMGPGIVGTSTYFGFSGTEQGQAINAIDSLGGMPVFVPRITFADRRERHYGISQQSIVNLKFIVRVPLCISLPFMSTDKMDFIEEQVFANSLNELHSFYYQDIEGAVDTLHDSGIVMKTMGRGLVEDPEFFTCAWLAGIEAALLATRGAINGQ